MCGADNGHCIGAEVVKRKESRASSKGAKRTGPASGARSKAHRWSGKVTRESDALDLESDVFNKDSPRAIARSLKRSAERSDRRKSAPFRSAMSMLTFYINRAGKNLSQSRRRVLDRAKDELRRLYKPTSD